MFGLKLSSLVVAASLAVSGASAATLDFLAEGNASERGVADGTVINFGGVNVTFSSNYYAYFDAGNAGVGVCKILDSNAQCTPASDDNLQAGETLTLAFDYAVNLSNLMFRDNGHNDITNSGKYLQIGVNGNPVTATTFAAASATVFSDITSITFGWGGYDPADYYISSAEAVAVVPVPASLPLLLGGIGLLGLGARRRKKKAA